MFSYILIFFKLNLMFGLKNKDGLLSPIQYSFLYAKAPRIGWLLLKAYQKKSIIYKLAENFRLC